MKIITGFLVQDGGTAQVCDIDVTKRPVEAKRKLGYLPEANPLYYEMYVREYLLFVAGVYSVKSPQANIKRATEMVGLTPESKKKIGQLSKGYKQRVGLAAALLHDPEVLILDEPTSGLDPNQIIEIRNVIKEQGRNKTVLFSSHVLQEVKAICDRVIIINKGELVADDQLSNLHHSNQNSLLKIVFKENVPVEVLQQLPTVKDLIRENNFSWKIVTDNVDEMLIIFLNSSKQ